MTGNDFMSWVLRSPLHGMLSNSMMLITVKGRKTGKEYTLPVSYYRQNGNLWVLTNRDRTWWKNVQDGAEVSLLLKRQPVSAFAEPELENQSVEQTTFRLPETYSTGGQTHGDPDGEGNAERRRYRARCNRNGCSSGSNRLPGK